MDVLIHLLRHGVTGGASAGMFLAPRALMINCIGGTAGALVEPIEAAALATAAPDLGELAAPQTGA